ncbi:hypothetical protein [uncultured Hymenobacter sp.]|uniref:hypothetical protein n=1 Tax=uncultured Hymenobacter sp. TaxID=170016 RepID=UPI0035CA4D61
MKKLFSIATMVLFIVGLLTLVSTVFPAQALALALAVPHGADVLHALVGGATGVSLACVVVPITSIVLDDCPNPGGLTDLHVIRRRDILTFPEPDADKVTLSTAIVPKPGCGFVPWEFAADSGEVNHKSSGDAGNQSIAHDLGVYVPRGSASTDAVVQAALNGDFVVIGRDSNGYQRVVGDKRRGVKFEHDYKSGKKGTDKNGTDFKFAGEGFTHVPYYYTAAIPVMAVPGS